MHSAEIRQQSESRDISLTGTNDWGELSPPTIQRQLSVHEIS